MQVIYAISLVAWLFVLGMSAMNFDSPGAFGDAATWLIVLFIAIYPIAFLVAAITGWVMFARRRHRAALLWNCLPLLWFVPLVALLIYAFAS